MVHVMFDGQKQNIPVVIARSTEKVRIFIAMAVAMFLFNLSIDVNAVFTHEKVKESYIYIFINEKKPQTPAVLIYKYIHDGM